MPSRCNKCKTGYPREGDSWCLGCSNLEHSQGLLKQGWNHSGIRIVAEEALLSSSRLVKAFFNLDRTPGRGAESSGSGNHPKAPAHEARSRSPARDSRPPIARSLPQPPRAPPPPPREERETKSEEGSDESWDVDPESEESERVVAAKSKAAPPASGESGRRAPPEPVGPPPGSHRGHHHQGHHSRHHGGHPKKRRGGSKRQKHWKNEGNPFRVTHRRLPVDQLGLAESFNEGLERKA